MRTNLFYSSLYHACLFLCPVVFSNKASAQKYYFQNFNVEQGLIQSQALDICQDSAGHLWIATPGGISRFDGKSFTGYTKRNGLISNYVQAIQYSKGYTWCGTQHGLSRFDGKEFRNLVFSNDHSQNFVTDILIDRANNIYCIVSGKIYKVAPDLTYKLIPAPAKTIFTSFTIEADGTIWAGSADGLLYTYQHEWNLISAVAVNPTFAITKVYAGPGTEKWIGTSEGLYTYKEKKITKFPFAESDVFVLDILCDREKNMWVATTRGVYFIDQYKQRHYNAASGLTDDAITCLFNDRENNTWLGSGGGNGIFRFKNNYFTRLDESSGLPNPSVVSFTKDKNGDLWIGTYGGGLARFSNEKISSILLPDKSALAKVINSCVTDANGDIWIGTAGAGLWKYNGKSFIKVPPALSKLPSPNIINLYKDDDNRIWIGTTEGAIVNDKMNFKQVEGTGLIFSAFLQIGNDSVLAGTPAGLQLISKGKNILRSSHPLLTGSDIKCFTKKGNEIWMGTTDNGIIIWDIQKNEVSDINSTDGLASEFIYSLITDEKGNVFAGTGRGIHKISDNNSAKKYNIKIYNQSDGLLGMENNQNAVLKEEDGSIWFGTSKGAFRYYPMTETKDSFSARIVPRSIQVLGKSIIDKKYTDSLESWYNIPLNLKLPYRENNLSFNFHAISFLHAEKVRYQYIMEGLETEWSPPGINNSVTYTSLPPGKYVFKVKALTDTGQISDHILVYPFEILTPFYKTMWFQLVIAFFLVLCGIIIQYIRSKLKQKRYMIMELLRQEEQNKVRQKTAEDFHDEMGNKLTRISLLADIMKSKLEQEKPEIKKIAEQIKENSIQLYSGTRDIIWSLNPVSDNLFEVLQRIRDFGYDLFQDTDIDFKFSGLSDNHKNIRLPIDFSRNIIMIAKEALNNTLKHSHCRQTVISVNKINGNEIDMTIKDDGSGFNREEAKSGHGIDNMSIRARRINANFSIDSLTGKGTTLTLTIKIPQKKG